MIELKNISKSFPMADGTVDALKNVSLTIADGEIYGIIGMSGAGKVHWFGVSTCWSVRPREKF